jgi:hypothetical protein
MDFLRSPIIGTSSRKIHLRQKKHNHTGQVSASEIWAAEEVGARQGRQNELQRWRKKLGSDEVLFDGCTENAIPSHLMSRGEPKESGHEKETHETKLDSSEPISVWTQSIQRLVEISVSRLFHDATCCPQVRRV